MDINKLAIACTKDDDTYGLVNIRIGHNWIVIYSQFALFHITMWTKKLTQYATLDLKKMLHSEPK